MRVGQPGHLVLLVLLLLLASPATASTQHGRLQNGQQAPLQHIHVAAPAPTSHAAQVPTAAQGTEPGGSAGEPRPPSYAPAARRLSLVPPASLTASGGPSKSSTQQNARRQSSCPSEYMEVTAPGCTCTVYHGDAGVGNSSDTDRLIRVNVCPAGQRCSPSAVQAIQVAGWSRAGGNATAALLKDLNPALTAQGICVPCQLGEYCPVGSQEETRLSLSACNFQMLAVLTNSTNSTAAKMKRKHPGHEGNPLTQAALVSGSCSGVQLCPGGSYCPSPAERKLCEPGRWCPQGSIKSQPCNITGILVWNPFRKAPGGSQLLLEALVKASQSLDGQMCPYNATNPLQGCPPGFFCPTPAKQLPCPAGHYCPGHTSAPVECPMLGSCLSEQEAAPDWSSVGLLLMFLVLLALLALLEYLRISGRCRRKAQSQEDDVMQLIEAVGFKMVGTHGSYHVSRAVVSQSADTRPHLRDALQPAATAIMGAPFVRASRQALGRALRGMSGHWHHQHTQPHPAAKPGDSSHAVLTVEGVPARHRSAAGGMFAWAYRKDGGASFRQNGQLSPANTASTIQSPFEVSALPSILSNGTDASAPQLEPELGAQGQAGSETSSDAEGEFTINPRLTLVFREVWVADMAIGQSLPLRAKRFAQGLCGRRQCPEGFAIDPDSSGPPGCPEAARQRRMQEKLEAAAASGAYFIVPGVSSRFPHSQLHAIMGPSGCGKTTLCKALAGRVPRTHMCGDVKVLCSSAADNFKAEVELTAAGSVDSAATACNISHMTGFVPQFDQLHETLTVLENLLLAAKLRLPVTGKGQGVSAAALRHMERQRQREVHKVVGEVMALMGLTKVATTVVGSSTQRLLSGGQRKRVAIAVELVSKPSLLWLDEPTSGLDAAVAFDVISALKASSQRGMNVLAIMHQPRCSIFDMFDSCLLLGSNGNVVYSGPQRMAQAYMAFLGFYNQANENLADFLLDVTAGVVPRPGDPDYIPSQLSAMWHKAGGIWVELQLRKEQQLHHHEDGLQPAATLQVSELLPVPAPAVQEPVDWPWRPRDLEALLSRFHLIMDNGRDGQMFHGVGFRTDADASRAHGSSVLSYDGFLAFWDESGIKELLGEEEYALFIEGLCEDFDMHPDSCITQAHFVQVLKSQLRAAAASAHGMPSEQHYMPSSAQGMPLHTAQLEQHLPASGVVGSAGAAGAADRENKPLARTSAFAAYSNTPLEELDPCEAAAQRCKVAAECAKATLVKFEGVDSDTACDDADEAILEAAVAACAADAAHQDAVAQCSAAAAAAEPCPGAAAAGTVPESHTAGQLSRTCSSATAFSNLESGAYGPGMLTCPQARLRQHTLLRQRTLGRQTSGRRDGMRSGPSRSGPSVTAEFAQQVQQQQCQQHMEALLRCRKMRKAAAAAAAQNAGTRQLSQVRMMQKSVTAARSTTRPPCASLQEARARCLDQLGDFLLMQESRQLGGQHSGGQPLQPTWSDMCTASGMADALQRSGNASYIVKLPPVPPDEEAAAAKADALPVLFTACASQAPATPAAAAAAAAAVRSRKLPSVLKQLQIVMVRSSWKEVHSRSALMTDLLLTSVLGLALGAAQGRNISPGSSLTWMLITLLAYGCISLVRSTRSYGSERHIYLQQESPAGVSVSAWVFGHQIIDLVGLVLHPLLFFAWMYVLTLTPVPAWSYFTTLAVVGIYTSGLGYLVSLTVHPNNAMIAGLAVALLLGGVANGVLPSIWQLEATHPLLWLDYLSYTRWGLQALYISWLIPAPAPQAPATATFLSGLGFCGLDPTLMQALSTRRSGWDTEESRGSMSNATAISGKQWWNMTSVQRADALVEATLENLQHSSAENRGEAAAAAAITQLWQYYNRPHMLDQQCRAAQGTAVAVLIGLGLLCRALVFVLVKWKVARKAQQ